MIIVTISDKLVKITPEEGKTIQEILSGRTHSVVYCSPSSVKQFKAIAA